MFRKKTKEEPTDVVIDHKRIEELEQQKREIERQKRLRTKRGQREQRRAEERERKRQEYKLIQSTQLSIPIRDVLRSIVITKDGRYLKLMEFAPQNYLMYPNEDRNLIAEKFAAMLRVIPAKIQFKVISRKAETETLLKTMRKCHDTESNPLCRRMQEEYIDLIQDTALREGVSRRFLIIVEYADDVATDGTNFRAIVASLNQTAARIKSYMADAGNRFIPSCETDKGVISLLYELLNRRAAETEPFSVRATKVYDHYAEAYKDDEQNPVTPATEFIAPAWIDFKHPSYMVVDDKFYTFGYFTAEGYPNYVQTGWMANFVNICEGIDVDIFMEKVPKEKVENAIGRRIRNNRAKLKDTSDTSTEATNVASLIQSGFYLLNGLAKGEDFYYANVILTITADSYKALEYRYGELEKAAHSMGVKLRRTNLQMEAAFESVLPLCKISSDIYHKSRRNMLSNGAASLYPFISYELQDPNGIMLGVNQENNSLVAVDVFDTAHHANANGAILGKSGYGKTFTAQLLAIRMRLQNIQTFIITPIKGEEDYKRACDQIDGQYIALGPGTKYFINIFDIHVPDRESLKGLDGYGEEVSLLAKKVQDLHTFMHLVVRDLTQEQEQVLDGYIYKVYAKYGITDDNDSIFIPGTRQYKKFPLLGDLYDEIKNDPVLKTVANILIPLVTGSLSVYNHETNVDLTNKYIVFDMNGTKGTNLILSLFITLDFVWSKIKENRLQKKAVFIDEAWQLIGSKSNEMAAEYVKEIFKTIRAFGGSAFVMTQEINDFFSLNDGEYGKAIIGNSDTKIILHLDEPDAGMVRDIVGLSNEEHKQIKTLQKGHGLVSTGNSKLFVDFKASPFETDVITTDPMYLRNKLKEQGRQLPQMAVKDLDSVADKVSAAIDNAAEPMDEDILEAIDEIAAAKSATDQQGT